jgi:CheY-like chemotaxis protein
MDTDLSPEQGYYLKQAKEAAGLLSYVIDDILDFSLIEAKKLKLQSEPFSLIDSVKCLIDLLGLKAKEKGLDLGYRMAPDLPEWIVGDEHRLRQVLLNLVGNAIKFTKRGSVRLNVDLERRDEVSQKHCLRFSVEDTGVGITAEAKDILFKPFSQGSDLFANGKKGTGLGLTICKEIVSLFNGDIWFESEPGKGSIFFFTACFGKCRRPSIPNETLEKTACASKLQMSKLLIVEDDPLIRNLVSLVLSNQNYQIVIANNGSEALEKWESDEFDLIIMDVQMPELDGLETTRQIRKKEMELGHHTPIIALTAHAMKEHESHCLEAGMDDFISKPLKINEFLSKIKKHLQ